MKKCICGVAIIAFLFSCSTVIAQDIAKSSVNSSEGVNHYSLMPKVYEKNWTGTGMPQEETARRHRKRFSFTASIDPDFVNTVPPVYLYFEWGIANVSSIGLTLGASYNERDYSTYNLKTAYVDLGLRGVAYPLPIISKITGNEINAFGFEPHLGLVYDYIGIGDSVNDEDPDTYTMAQFGACFGTRWYPGDRRGFALFAEYNTNGIGNSYYNTIGGGRFNNSGSFRVGITLGR